MQWNGRNATEWKGKERRKQGMRKTGLISAIPSPHSKSGDPLRYPPGGRCRRHSPHLSALAATFALSSLLYSILVLFLSLSLSLSLSHIVFGLHPIHLFPPSCQRSQSSLSFIFFFFVCFYSSQLAIVVDGGAIHTYLYQSM